MKYYYFLIILLFTACNSRQTEQILSHAGRDASCPHITKTEDDKIIISWVEAAPGADTGTVYYAVSSDGGISFTTPRQIPTITQVFPHGENMPKLVCKPDGEMIVMYGIESGDARNPYAGRVLYTRSADNGKTWSPSQPLVADTGSYDQRYFDMNILPNGQAAAIWLDNRKHTDDEGSTLYYAVTGTHTGFLQEKPLAETVCQCCRTALYTDATGGIHIAYRDIINDSIRDMVHMVSTNGGASFATPVRISADNWVVRGCPHTGPAMVKNNNGLHFAWFTMGGGQGVFYCRSLDNGQSFTQKEPVSTVPMAKHPQLTVLGNEHIMMVWDEPVKVDKAFNSRVSFQTRTGDGKVLDNGTLTPDSCYVTFPVLTALGKDKALVAYTKRVGESEQVCYQVIGF